MYSFLRGSGDLPMRKSRNAGVSAAKAPGFSLIGGTKMSQRCVKASIWLAEKKVRIGRRDCVCGLCMWQRCFGIQTQCPRHRSGGGGVGLAICCAQSSGAMPSATIGAHKISSLHTRLTFLSLAANTEFLRSVNGRSDARRLREPLYEACGMCVNLGNG